MAFAAGGPGPEPQRSQTIGLTLTNLSSNNPFRNRTLSPAPSPVTSPVTTDPSARSRPLSTNPFLDSNELPALAPSRSNDGRTNNGTPIPDDIFSDLSLLDKPSANGESMAGNTFIIEDQDLTASSGSSQPPRPPPSRSGPPPGYRPGVFEERRAPPRPSRGPDSPVKRDLRHSHHQRRASESSVMDKERRPRVERDRGERPERTESEERRRRERRREREERHRREKERSGNGERGERSGKRHRKPQGLDIIDKLDVTGIYGQGLFHHDGPFDACNPHRNAKKDRRAPMQAFPEGSANMALGGAGPLNTRIDLDKFHGRGAEGFSEYAAARKQAPNFIDPRQGIEPVHGEESYGLGTSTFLEGAPASKSALQRRDSEDPAADGPAGGGLARKKSLAQRLRGMSASRRNLSGDIRSPDARYRPGSSDLDSPPPSQPQIKALSAGGPSQAKYNKENEINPFENDYEAAFEKKGTQIRIAEQERPSDAQPRTPSSPKPSGLTRSKTSDGGVPTRARGSSSNEEERPNGGGFLNRMKSLKGGPRRVRNEA